MQQSHAAKFGAPVPRYTSYPTAPHFHAGVNADQYSGWLAELTSEDSLSLYLHVPFCDRLCWFCGCHTKQTLRYDPIRDYLKRLHGEIDLVADALTANPQVIGVHFGGGSPSMIAADDFTDLMNHLRERFAFGAAPEISVEIDPADITPDRVEAMVLAGLSRVSVGVQDFDPQVQAAINRPQTFELTQSVVDAMRAAGVHSVNLDVLYGLPHQTNDSIARTIEKLVSLSPDRVALFGYAHVPWMKKHQKMIDEAILPDISARFSQADLAAQMLSSAGFMRIGFDHFAQPDDSLAVASKKGVLRRNFQGYTDDPATSLIGFGASSIGEGPYGYVQNITATGQYMAAIDAGILPISKGYASTSIDIARKWAIERLMCDMFVSPIALRERFGTLADPIISDIAAILEDDVEGLVVAEGDALRVTETGRPFVRVIAARLDSYLQESKARHSLAV